MISAEEAEETLEEAVVAISAAVVVEAEAVAISKRMTKSEG